MVDVNVNVKDALIIAKKFKDSQNDVYPRWSANFLVMGSEKTSLTINVTEATSLALLRVMKTTSPVHSYIAFTPVQSCSTLHTAACADSTELEKAIEHWAIIPYIESTLLFLVCFHVIRRDFVEKIDVFICMELGHLELAGRLRTLWDVSN